MKKQNDETLEERIEKSAEYFKQEMIEKSKRLLALNHDDTLTIDLIESFWKESRQNSDKLLFDFYNDITNKEIQKEQVSKKKLN